MIIKASIIFEIIGRPAEFLVESLEEVVKKVSEEKGVKIIKSTVHQPKDVPDKKGIYSSFVEVEADFDNQDSLFMTMFNYMPANVEIVKPEEWKFTINEFNIFVNELLRKLHQYDSLAKAFILEKNNMQAYINEMQEKLQNLSEEIKMPKLEVSNFGEERAEKKSSKKAKKSKK
ncbi:MAG: hypothetical protein AABW73_02870 [Nanoarchaeota archaeon]